MDVLDLEVKMSDEEGMDDEDDRDRDSRTEARGAGRGRHRAHSKESSDSAEAVRSSTRKRRSAVSRYSPDATTPKQRANAMRMEDEQPHSTPSVAAKEREVKKSNLDKNKGGKEKDKQMISDPILPKTRTSAVVRRFSPDPSPTMRQNSAKVDNEQQTNPTAAKVTVNSRSSTGQKMTSPPAKKPPVVNTSLPSPVPPINNATNDIKQEPVDNKAAAGKNNTPKSVPASEKPATFKPPVSPALPKINDKPAKQAQEVAAELPASVKVSTRHRKSITNRFSPEVELPQKEKKAPFIQHRRSTADSSSKCGTPPPVLELQLPQQLTLTLSEFGMILKTRTEIAGAGNWIEYAFPRTWKDGLPKTAFVKPDSVPPSVHSSASKPKSTNSPSTLQPTGASPSKDDKNSIASLSTLDKAENADRADEPQDFPITELLAIGLSPQSGRRAESHSPRRKQPHDNTQLAAQEKALPTADVSPLFVVAKSEEKISKEDQKEMEQRVEEITKDDEEMEEGEGELKEEDNKKENLEQKHSIQRNVEEQSDNEEEEGEDMLLESPRLKIVDTEDDDFFALPKPVQEHEEEEVEEEESKIEENSKSPQRELNPVEPPVSSPPKQKEPKKSLTKSNEKKQKRKEDQKAVVNSTPPTLATTPAAAPEKAQTSPSSAQATPKPTTIPPLTMKTRGRARQQQLDRPDDSHIQSPLLSSPPSAKLSKPRRPSFGSPAQRPMIKLPRRIKLKVGNETSVIIPTSGQEDSPQKGSSVKQPKKAVAATPSKEGHHHDTRGRASKLSPVAGETGKAADEASVPIVQAIPKSPPKKKPKTDKPTIVNGVFRNYKPSAKPFLGHYKYPDGKLENLTMVITPILDKMLLDVCQDGVAKHANILTQKEKKKRAIEHIKQCYNDRKKLGQQVYTYKSAKLREQQRLKVATLSQTREKRKIVSALEKNDDFLMIPLKREKKEPAPVKVKSISPSPDLYLDRKENDQRRARQTLANYFENDMEEAVSEQQQQYNTGMMRNDLYTWDDEMDQYLLQSQSQPHSFHRDSSVASGSALSAFPLTPSTAAAQTGQSGQFDFDYEQSMEYDDMQPQIGEDRMLGGREDGIGRRDRPEKKKKPARPLVRLTDYVNTRFGFENGQEMERQLLPSRSHIFDSNNDPFYSEILSNDQQYYDSSCRTLKDEFGDEVNVGGAEDATELAGWTGIPLIETQLQMNTARQVADEIEKTMLRPCSYDGTTCSINDLYNRAFEEPFERRSMLESVVELISEQYSVEITAQGRPDEMVTLYNATMRNANQLRDFYFTYSYDRQQSANWAHRFIVENLPVHFLASYLSLLRYCRSMAGSYVMMVLKSAGGPSMPSDWQTVTHLIQEYVTLKVLDPELDDLNRTIEPHSLSDVVFVLASPAMTVGDYTHKVKAHEHMFKWLKQLGHSDSEIVKLDIEDDDRLTIPELCDAYMAHFLHVIRSKVKEHRGRRIVLVGFGTTCYMCHRAVQLTHGVSAIIDLAFPLFTEEGPRGTPDDDICLTYCPSLFVLGSDADDFDAIALKDLRDNLLSPSGLIVVCSADKELYVRTSVLMRMKLTQRLVQRAIVDEVCSFLKLEITKRERSALMPHELHDILTVEDQFFQEPIMANYQPGQQPNDGTPQAQNQGQQGQAQGRPQPVQAGNSGRRATTAGNEDEGATINKQKKAYRTGSNDMTPWSSQASSRASMSSWQNSASMPSPTPFSSRPLAVSPPSSVPPQSIPLHPANFSIPSALQPLDGTPYNIEDARSRFESLIKK
ncbi:hypothetical protein WR25_24362 [Diploscapter pachys]|uniref:KANSL3 helical domain-containing protein n=1 Tax=Diploscapter pachys TaxID=2018661 RepID=A0A2A2LRR4_9BILA|nr:hypothetical protein WR25_24362 [Diploscapter pachys]